MPDFRAVIAAMAVAVGLIMVSFALVATFRVARENRSTTLQASLTERLRDPLGEDARASATQPAPHRAVLIVETPGPHLAPVPPALDPPISVKVARIAEAAPDPIPVARVETLPIAPLIAAPSEAGPAADPPMGGPLAEPLASGPEAKSHIPRVTAVETAERDLASERDLARKAAEQKAAEKKAAAEKARKARIAREKKKAAARRAAQAAKQKASTFGNNQFGNGTFGGTFTNQQ